VRFIAFSSEVLVDGSSINTRGQPRRPAYRSGHACQRDVKRERPGSGVRTRDIQQGGRNQAASAQALPLQWNST